MKPKGRNSRRLRAIASPASEFNTTSTPPPLARITSSANPSERERLSLYYEIGITYDSIGDRGEALYYFEAVTKRDPRFADASQRADAVRAMGGRAVQPDDDL